MIFTIIIASMVILTTVTAISATISLNKLACPKHINDFAHCTCPKVYVGIDGDAHYVENTNCVENVDCTNY